MAIRPRFHVIYITLKHSTGALHKRHKKSDPKVAFSHQICLIKD